MLLGVLAIAGGIIYFAEPAKSLPAFFPGRAAHLTGRHTRRGLAGIIAGAVLLIITVITARVARRSSRYQGRRREQRAGSCSSPGTSRVADASPRRDPGGPAQRSRPHIRLDRRPIICVSSRVLAPPVVVNLGSVSGAAGPVVAGRVVTERRMMLVKLG